MSGARKTGLVIFGAILVALFAGIAVAQGIGNPSVPSGDIALVEEVPDGMGDITKEQYDRTFAQTWRRAGLEEAPEPGDAQFEQVKDASIEDRLDRAWLTGEAAELGVNATEREVRNEFRTVREDQFPNEEAFQTFLEDSDFTMDEILDRVRLQVLSRKIEESITNEVDEVPADEIEDFYEASKENFTTPETRDIRLIVAENQSDADEVEAALDESSENRDFARLAREFSTHGSSNQGGNTVATEGAFPDPAGSEIMSAETDTVVGPIEADGEFYFFKVNEVTPEETQSLEDVTEQITQQLLPTRQQQAMTDFVADYNAKWTARTFCAEGFIVARCSNFQGDGRIELADPACYEQGAGDPDREQPLSCPAPVQLRSPISPGDNAAAADPLAPAAQTGLPQGPVVPGDADDAAAAAAEGLEGAGGAGAPGGAPVPGGQ